MVLELLALLGIRRFWILGVERTDRTLRRFLRRGPSSWFSGVPGVLLGEVKCSSRMPLADASSTLFFFLRLCTRLGDSLEEMELGVNGRWGSTIGGGVLDGVTLDWSDVGVGNCCTMREG